MKKTWYSRAIRISTLYAYGPATAHGFGTVDIDLRERRRVFRKIGEEDRVQVMAERSLYEKERELFTDDVDTRSPLHDFP